MSQIQTPGIDQNGSGPARRTRRAASVTLREGDQRTQTVGDLMDPANKSLTEALRIAYRLLQGLIVVMLVVFAFSSTQTVETSEIGVRTTMGRIDRDDLGPGFHLSWPEPFGKIIKIARTDQRFELNKEFFPGLTDPEEKLLSEKGTAGLAEGGRDFLDADSDGGLLTADGAIVHTRWQITYTRTKDSRSLRNISSDIDAVTTDLTERRIVNAAVRRAIIQAAATMTIDEVLFNQKDPARTGPLQPLSETAKAVAQKQLDAMDLGIVLQQFDMKTPMAPRTVITSFSSVQTAQSKAKQQRDQAEGEAKNRLLKAAGEGAPVILDLIDRYERDLASNDADKAARTLQSIHDYMRRKPITIDDKPVAVSVSGDVTSTVAQAEQYRTGIVTRASADASAFNAKLAAYRANPQVFLTGEWADAVGSILSRETTQTMILPPNLERLLVQINRDPYLSERIQKKRDDDLVEKNRKKIEDNRRRELWQKKFDGTSMEGS